MVLLQPTSPFRLKEHLLEAFDKYKSGCDMVVSVKKVKANILATYYSDDKDGLINKLYLSSDNSLRRQDGQLVYELNGSFYVMNLNSLKKSSPSDFSCVKKVVMDEIYSADIDEPLDWIWCEFLIKEKLVSLS